MSGFRMQIDLAKSLKRNITHKPLIIRQRAEEAVYSIRLIDIEPTQAFYC